MLLCSWLHGCVELQQAGEGVKGPNFPLFASAGSAHLHLDEPHTHAFLGKGTDNDKIDGWYLNTGATHHMIGRCEFFSDLGYGVKGSVKFGDASAIEIKGVSSIILKAKSGGAPSPHRRVLHPSLEELHHQHRAARREWLSGGDRGRHAMYVG